VLIPRGTWADPAAYDAAAAKLAGMFHANFETYAEGVSEEVRSAGPAVVRDVDLDDVRVSAPGEG
jgi:phosphoenolpyruvate carboxykinase (ATP)